jgi:hypothetical protein
VAREPVHAIEANAGERRERLAQRRGEALPAAAAATDSTPARGEVRAIAA